MTTSCAVASCKNTHLKGSNIYFFHFPKTNARLKNVWVQKCYRKRKFNVSTSRICSAHFTNDDFENYLQYQMMGNVGKLILKVGAIPSQNLKNDDDVYEKHTER